jgi:hypothetical protein
MMSPILSLNDLKLELASLIGLGKIQITTPNDEIRKHINATDSQIEEAIYHLKQDQYEHEYEQQLAELDEDFFDGY